MKLSFLPQRELLCSICRNIWQKEWVAANDGNVSAKLEDGSLLTTATGISKGLMVPEMLIRVDLQGNILEAQDGWQPSSELKMHLRCYKERADVGAVVHAHPPIATAFAVANRPLDEYSMIETVLGMGSVPIAPYATPSTDEVPDAIAPFLASHDAILLQSHGALTVGQDLMTAYYKMESLEHFAKISLNAHLLGGAQELSKDNIDKLLSIRNQYGLKGRHPGYKKYS